MSVSSVFAAHALLPEGWARDVRLEVDEAGQLTRVAADAAPEGAQTVAGPVIPGVPNLHSHAFQRAMAGLGERASGAGDSFWTWREVMYRFLDRLTPEQVEAIAAQLYVEMLKAGYTAVGEFHYLHHDPEGRPYADPAEMSRRIVAAARTSGIGITLLPVLYGYGGFGGQPAGAGQRRFLNTPARLRDIAEAIRRDHVGDGQVAVGLAPHSLRAVTAETLREALDGLDDAAPIHVHVAEQQKEVEDCLAWSGRRPVEWLTDNFEPDGRWCLVHATHVTADETAAIARSGAVAGLCPTTEANLGDGLFPAGEFLEQGGRFGIGSDSHISVSPIEELRWLEYGQRLRHLRRNLLVEQAENASVGASLLRRALDGGAQALGRPIGRLAEGSRADLLVLDPENPSLYGRSSDDLLDALIFAGNTNPVRDVMVGGKWVVEAGRHAHEDAVFARYKAAVTELVR